MLYCDDCLFEKIENYSKLKLSETEKKFFFDEFTRFNKMLSILDKIKID